jgi:hypothetical protein
VERVDIDIVIISSDYQGFVYFGACNPSRGLLTVSETGHSNLIDDDIDP